jgi:hypothetical protein
MRVPAFPALAVSIPLLLCACDGGGTGSDGGAGFTAKIDGKDWSATEIGTTAMVVAGVPGTLIISGSDGAEPNSRSITLSLYNVRGPGRYPLGVSTHVVGGIGQTAEAAGAGGDADDWITPGTGDDGLVEITALGGGRIQGTFFFTADSGRGNSSGVPRTVTEGRFDLALTGTLATLKENKGSTFTARLGGTHYNAATVLAFPLDFTGQPGIRISTATSLHGVSLELQGVTETGTYALTNTQPIRTITAGHTGGDAAHCCWQTAAGDAGEIRVTYLDSNRVKGTFRGVIKPTAGKSATAPLEILEGSFDVGFGI